MSMSPRTEALFGELAETLGVPGLVPDANGGVQLTIGESGVVVIYAETGDTLLIAAPVMTLPRSTDYATALWLLRRNFYDSPVAPFQIGCDKAGSLVVWGRLPVENLDGPRLAQVVDALAAEAAFILGEVPGEPTEDDAEDGIGTTEPPA
jgi:Tir chaperone protein (CesT) family